MLTAACNKELRKTVEVQAAPPCFLFYDRPKIYGLGKNLFGGRMDDCQK
jgi:hypothetical protein